MWRSIQPLLDAWLAGTGRKPLVLRGARQVGKTWLVRDLATRHGRDLVELNFERDPQLKRHFTSNDPSRVLDDLSLARGRTISPDNTLLFLDEIQAAGELMAKLRWFAEELPRMPVVAAGSLIEFTLAEHSFSMPVGRIAFLHVEPMGFREYLVAHGQDLLVQRLDAWVPGTGLSSVVHEQALVWVHRFAMVGGMPGVVARDVAGADAAAIRELQLDLVATYRADFGKYSRRLDPRILDGTLDAVARSVGTKFIFTRVGEGSRHDQARRALQMLTSARLCHVVRHTASNGLPLAGEVKDTLRKVILNDIGLYHALLRSPGQAAFPRWDSLSSQVRGQIAEQVVGQLLRLLGPASGDGPELYYWQREGGRPGEVDYLVQAEGSIVPVELKSGAAGAMKSLHQFMHDKRLGFAVRFDQNEPSELDVVVRTTQGDPVSYHLRSLPWYMAGYRRGLLSSTVSGPIPPAAAP